MGVHSAPYGCALPDNPQVRETLSDVRVVGECVDLCATGPQVLAERGRNEGAHVFIRN